MTSRERRFYRGSEAYLTDVGLREAMKLETTRAGSI